MPDIAWSSRREMAPSEGYLVMASHLPLKSLRSTVPFFRAVVAVRKQLAGAEGLVAYTLRAKPMAGDYWTLSVWADEAALRLFMRSPPHLEVMRSLRPVMGPTRFVQWEVSGSDGRPSWETALSRLAAG